MNISIGAHVRQQRRREGLSLRDLGQVLGITDQQVRKYEAGETWIGAAQLLVLARALHTPIDRFFEDGSDLQKDAAANGLASLQQAGNS